MLRSMLLAASGLASRNRRCENVRVLPVIVAELELGDIERHVLAADLANNVTFEDRPEALDCVRVNRADNIFVRGVIDATPRPPR
jgi:hypothetical protein